MKGKAKFKNPFDLMEQDDQKVSFTPHSYYPNISNQQSQSNPLPFNPYQINNSSNVNLQQSTPIKPIELSAKSNSNIIQNQTPVQNPSAFMPSPYNPSAFEPRQAKPQKVYQLDENGDPPLLDDIGIDLQMIKERVLIVLKMQKPNSEMMADPDLSGPILIALLFGFLLLLAGKIHFGDIYAVFIFGNLLVYIFFNFMGQKEIIPLYNIMSTMGYGLLPMLLLGLVGIFVSLNSRPGVLIGIGLAIWSSVSSGGIMEALMQQQNRNRKALIVYPLFLFYVSFAMIVMF